MKRFFIKIVINLIVITLVLSGCNRSIFSSPAPVEPTPQVLPINPHIRGKITTLILYTDGTAYITVKGVLEADTQYDQAYIGLHADAKMLIEENGEYRDGSLSELELGQTVEVWFVGAIHTSYPVQATAGKIIVQRNPTPTPPPNCVPFPQEPTSSATLTPTPRRSDTSTPVFRPSVTPRVYANIIDLNPDLPIEEKSEIVVFRCDGTFDQYWAGPDTNIELSIPLQPGDRIIQSVPPAIMMGHRPPEPK